MIPLHSAESAARSPWAALAGVAIVAIASAKISADFNLYPYFAFFSGASWRRPHDDFVEEEPLFSDIGL